MVRRPEGVRASGRLGARAAQRLCASGGADRRALSHGEWAVGRWRADCADRSGTAAALVGQADVPADPAAQALRYVYAYAARGGGVVGIILNQAAPLVRGIGAALQGLRAPAQIAVTLGEI